LRGLWHAHIGWFLTGSAQNLSRYVQDLRQSAAVRVASAMFPVWVALGLLIPAGLGGLLTGTWMGALFGLIWGGHGPDLPGPSRDLERQLGLPPVGRPALPRRRPQPQ